MGISRREFLKKSVIGGVAVYIVPLVATSEEAEYIYPAASKNWNHNNKTNYRMDAIPKVIGDKIYARDFRSKDFENWPKSQWHAIILRATKANYEYLGINIDEALKDFPPTKVITNSELKENNIALPAFYDNEMLLEPNNTPRYIGHPVAMLLFDNFTNYIEAKSILQNNDSIIRYGEQTEYRQMDPYATFRFIRYNDGKDEKFSNYQNGMIFPNIEDHQAVWPDTKNPNGTTMEKGMYYADRILDEMNDSSVKMIERHYTSPIIDPVMLEPEAALIWYDKSEKALHIVASAQDPTELEEMAVHMAKESSPFRNIKKMYVHSGFLGGGFGAKDHSIFPYYALAAGMFTNGEPVRLVNSRYEQFQAGIKRHPFKVHHRLAVDPKTKKFQSFKSILDMDGGGRTNYSPVVAIVSAAGVQGSHYFPQGDSQVVCRYSRNVDSGSMRGFGCPQAMATFDMLVNEAAHEFKMDPIELRKKNVMQLGDKNNQGFELSGTPRGMEILNKAQKHPIWVNRNKNKIEFEKNHPHEKFGVGFSMMSKKYGTGAVAPKTEIVLTREGKLIVNIEYTEMGQGAQTSQGVVTKRYLGRHADEVQPGHIHWQGLQMYMTQSPWFMDQAHQDKMSKDPRWTPMLHCASSASDSATFQSEITIEASRVLFKHGLWPAALHIWGELYKPMVIQATPFREEDAVWVNGALTVRGLKPLPLPLLAMVAHKQGFVTSVMAHGFNRWAWAEAEFTIDGKKDRYFLDAIAVQYGDFAPASKKKLMDTHNYHALKRNSVNYPPVQMNQADPTYSAPCANLVELSVNIQNGKVTLHKIHSMLDCGPPIVPELVAGQTEGGIAMGIGHVLHEYLPAFEQGAGMGNWNLDRYHIPYAKDVPVWQLTTETLKPQSPHERAKGMAEVVMLPVISAVQEGIFQAIGHRFYDCPISPKQILEALYPNTQHSEKINS